MDLYKVCSSGRQVDSSVSKDERNTERILVAPNKGADKVRLEFTKSAPLGTFFLFGEELSFDNGSESNLMIDDPVIRSFGTFSMGRQ